MTAFNCVSSPFNEKLKPKTGSLDFIKILCLPLQSRSVGFLDTLKAALLPCARYLTSPGQFNLSALLSPLCPSHTVVKCCYVAT